MALPKLSRYYINQNSLHEPTASEALKSFGSFFSGRHRRSDRDYSYVFALVQTSVDEIVAIARVRLRLSFRFFFDTRGLTLGVPTA